MKKVILNKDYGVFDVSFKAYSLYAKKKGLKLYAYEPQLVKDSKGTIYEKINKDRDTLFTEYFTKDFGDVSRISDDDYEKYRLYLDKSHREDKVLIEVVEELKEKANGRYGKLKVVEIPDNLKYVIDDYYGIETLHQEVQEW